MEHHHHLPFIQNLHSCRHPGMEQTTQAQLTTSSMKLIQSWVLPLWRLAFWRRTRRPRWDTEEKRKVELWRSVWDSHPHPHLLTLLKEILWSLCPQVTSSSRFVFVSCATELYYCVNIYYLKRKCKFNVKVFA